MNDVLHDDDASEFEHMRSEHAGVLEKYLKTKPDLYPAIATDYDRANPELVQNRLESQTHHPYYVAGDFNGDGKEDFAVIFKSLKAQKSFTVAIFNAPFNKNNAQPAFYGKSDYRFVLHYNKKPEAAAKSLYIGSYDSDDGFIIEPNGKGYKVVDLSANMP